MGGLARATRTLVVQRADGLEVGIESSNDDGRELDVSELPRGARPDLSVDGTIEIERLDDVLYTGRPAYGQAESTIGLFKIEPQEF